MNVLVFDIKGRFAHFRKFYTNSSSLSYSVPPRTTIEGIVAAILGYERDSYYEILSAEKLNIAVKKLTKTRRIMQSLNYIKATGAGDILVPKDHTQIPFEIITGNDGVSYRVYVTHSDEDIFIELKNKVKNNKTCYPPYFGSAAFNCSIKYLGSYNGEEMDCIDFTPISTLINQELIEDKGIDIRGEELSLIKERMPRDFNKDREIKDVSSYIFDEEGKNIRVKLKKKCLRLETGENILFL